MFNLINVELLILILLNYLWELFFVELTGYCFGKFNLPDLEDLPDFQGQDQRSKHSFKHVHNLLEMIEAFLMFNFPWSH